MKTKLAFLAVPFCLGLVLTFVLAACTSGSSNGPSEEPSSSSTVYAPSSEITSELITFDLFDVVPNSSGDRIDITGKINGSKAQPIVSLVFYPDNLISYDGPTTGISISLNGKASIDLTKLSIPCGESSFTVKACTEKVGNVENCTSKNGKFTKDPSLCVSSSSGAVSSSSEAVWRFGTMQSIEASQNTVTIGSGAGAASFRLKENENDVGIDLTGCKIISTGLIFIDYNTDDDGSPKPGDGYNKFRDLPSGSNHLDMVQNKEYYIIESGDTKYLIWFKINDPTFDKWPKTVRYWPVTESP